MYIVWELHSTHDVILSLYTKSPLKEIWIQGAKENLTSVGFEPMTSGLDLPMLYQLYYEASTGAGRGNLGSESQLVFR